MAIQVGESTKSRRGPKAIAHLEIYPKLGGGHVVRHVYQGYVHEPKEFHFNKEGKASGGEHIMAHLAKHAGIDGGTPYDKRNESETEHEIED